jgi:transcriptional regulator with XRE-family HTH domain
MVAEKQNGRVRALEQAIGARMRARRRQLGLSQSELAEKLGVSFQQVQKYERGANRVAASTLVTAAEALGVTVGWLVGEDQPLAGGETDLLLALGRPGAIEILQAFNAIVDARRRNALLAVAEEMAERD